MRKLRKNKAYKKRIGFEFIGGQDTFKVTFSLMFPKLTTKWLQSPKGNDFSIDPVFLYQHTTIFDRLLARTLDIILFSSIVLLVPLALIEFFIK